MSTHLLFEPGATRRRDHTGAAAGARRRWLYAYRGATIDCLKGGYVGRPDCPWKRARCTASAPRGAKDCDMASASCFPIPELVSTKPRAPAITSSTKPRRSPGPADLSEYDTIMRRHRHPLRPHDVADGQLLGPDRRALGRGQVTDRKGRRRRSSPRPASTAGRRPRSWASTPTCCTTAWSPSACPTPTETAQVGRGDCESPYERPPSRGGRRLASAHRERIRKIILGEARGPDYRKAGRLIARDNTETDHDDIRLRRVGTRFSSSPASCSSRCSSVSAGASCTGYAGTVAT